MRSLLSRLMGKNKPTKAKAFPKALPTLVECWKKFTNAVLVAALNGYTDPDADFRAYKAYVEGDRALLMELAEARGKNRKLSKKEFQRAVKITEKATAKAYAKRHRRP